MTRLQTRLMTQCKWWINDDMMTRYDSIRDKMIRKIQGWGGHIKGLNQQMCQKRMEDPLHGNPT